MRPSLWLAPLVLLGCATSIVTGSGGSGGAGGDGGAGATGGGGSGATGGGGSGATGGSGPCTNGADCAGLTDVCNVGTCINGACEKVPANDGVACDDGKQCTVNDTCQDGVCTSGNLKFCGSSDSCHVGYCDPQTDTCEQAPGNDGAACDDGDPCTYDGVCQNGACGAGQGIDCSFLDGPCSVGACDPALGCVAIPQADGMPCDDQLYCTIGDACSNGVCTGAPNPCAPPQNPCLTGVCNEAQQTCVVTAGNDGAACSDGNDCTVGETCSAGQCAGGAPGNDGAACDDGDGCTLGTTCAGGTCAGATSTIGACTSGDQCCPAGCSLAQDGDCLYWASGVQTNVAPATLQGWTQCWSGAYDQTSVQLGSLLQTCSKAKLLMACKPQNAVNWTLLAMAPRADVLFDCGQQTNCTKQSNGVGWYYDEEWSWGFAPGGQAVNRFSCDYDDGTQLLPELRLCWHTGGNAVNPGYRCGDNDLNAGSTWDRAIFHAD